MTIRSHFRGHPTVYVGEFPENGKWIYEDTGEPLPGWGGEIRPCKRCGSKHEGHESDPCIGTLPGVNNACCGHGVRGDSYIRFTNGVTVEDFRRREPGEKTKWEEHMEQAEYEQAGN